MIQFRKISLEVDYATLQTWWKGHGAFDVDRRVLPDGWIAHAAGIEIAASFLYVMRGHINGLAIIEFTTTNPLCALSRDLAAAVKGLYERLEIEARERGCIAVLSFVASNSWEHRTMLKMGYATSSDAKHHITLAKPIASVEAAV